MDLGAQINPYQRPGEAGPSHAHTWPEPQAHEPRASSEAEEGARASPWTVLP